GYGLLGGQAAGEAEAEAGAGDVAGGVAKGTGGPTSICRRKECSSPGYARSEKSYLSERIRPVLHDARILSRTMHPLSHVPEHIVQPPPVGFLLSDRMRLALRVDAEPASLLQRWLRITITPHLLRCDVARVERGLRASPRCVLPFRLGRQPVARTVVSCFEG